MPQLLAECKELQRELDNARSVMQRESNVAARREAAHATCLREVEAERQRVVEAFDEEWSRSSGSSATYDDAEARERALNTLSSLGQAPPSAMAAFDALSKAGSRRCWLGRPWLHLRHCSSGPLGPTYRMVSDSLLPLHQLPASLRGLRRQRCRRTALPCPPASGRLAKPERCTSAPAPRDRRNAPGHTRDVNIGRTGLASPKGSKDDTFVARHAPAARNGKGRAGLEALGRAANANASTNEGDGAWLAGDLDWDMSEGHGEEEGTTLAQKSKLRRSSPKIKHRR